MADAHPLGRRPFARPQYVGKFRALADGIITQAEQDRFLGLIDRLPTLTPDELASLSFAVEPSRLGPLPRRGIFDRS